MWAEARLITIRMRQVGATQLLIMTVGDAQGVRCGHTSPVIANWRSLKEKNILDAYYL